MGSIEAPIYIVGVEVLVLTWLVLYVLLVSSAAARTSEIVLGKLRGLTPARPRYTPSSNRCARRSHRARRSGCGRSCCTQPVPRSSGQRHAERARHGLGGGRFAGLGGVIATMITSVAALRRSVIEQWRRAQRRPRRVGWVLETVVATLALAGVVELVTTPASWARPGSCRSVPPPCSRSHAR